LNKVSNAFRTNAFLFLGICHFYASIDLLGEGSAGDEVKLVPTGSAKLIHRLLFSAGERICLAPRLFSRSASATTGGHQVRCTRTPDGLPSGTD